MNTLIFESGKSSTSVKMQNFKQKLSFMEFSAIVVCLTEIWTLRYEEGCVYEKNRLVLFDVEFIRSFRVRMYNSEKHKRYF